VVIENGIITVLLFLLYYGGASAGMVMATVFWDLHRQPGEGQNGHGAVLCRIIGLIRRRIAENTAPFGEEKSALPS